MVNLRVVHSAVLRHGPVAGTFQKRFKVEAWNDGSVTLDQLVTLTPSQALELSDMLIQCACAAEENKER